MNNFKKSNNDGNIAFGFIILGIGIILLLRKVGIFIPGWVTTWPMVFIAIGVFAVIKHEFRSFFGFVMVFLGAYFLLRNEFDFDLPLFLSFSNDEMKKYLSNFKFNEQHLEKLADLLAEMNTSKIYLKRAIELLDWADELSNSFSFERNGKKIKIQQLLNS